MLYPILNESRNLIDLSGVWELKLDDGTGFDKEWYAKKLDNTYHIAVPASYNDQVEDINFRDHYGYVFYQRNVAIPKMITSERVVLRFGAVTHYAKVYWNGKLIKEHKGGFLPFEVEINDYIKSGDNLLTVAVDNVVDLSTLPVGSETGGNMLGAALPSMPGVTTKKKMHQTSISLTMLVLQDQLKYIQLQKIILKTLQSLQK